MEITPELRAEIIQSLRVQRAPIKVARRLGIDIRYILPIADEEVSYSSRFSEERHGGWGRPELRDYAVARKRAFEVWDNSDPTIAAARTNYEAGTHDMVSGRDGSWLILYSIPQTKVTPRPNYFKPEY